MSAVASCFEILYQDKERNGAILDYILNLGQRYYDAFFADARYTAYLEGIKNTLIISLFAVLLGVLLGVRVAVMKYVAKGSKNPVIRFLDKVCKLYVTVIRATPVYLQIFIIANLIFTARNMEIYAAITCFGINSGAYVSEIIRAGIESIDRGQFEAGQSLGLSQGTIMKSIILPQAIKNILPALGNEFITLIKETAVAGAIAVTDVTKAAQYIGSRTWDVLPPLFIAAGIYLIIVLGLTKLLGMFERRLAASDHH